MYDSHLIKSAPREYLIQSSSDDEEEIQHEFKKKQIDKNMKTDHKIKENEPNKATPNNKKKTKGKNKNKHQKKSSSEDTNLVNNKNSIFIEKQKTLYGYLFAGFVILALLGIHFYLYTYSK